MLHSQERQNVSQKGEKKQKAKAANSKKRPVLQLGCCFCVKLLESWLIKRLR
ncbi:hypothetical protein Plhal304r1_c012g0047561 [Plasmopara halstedii]